MDEKKRCSQGGAGPSRSSGSLYAGTIQRSFGIYWVGKVSKGLLWCSDGEESACNVGDLGSIPGLERSSGEGNSCPLQYSCLENSMDRRAWRATVRRVTKSRTKLSDAHAQGVQMEEKGQI